ncbi:MAG: pilus assembly PilX N-terminal domain-containing protein [Mariprofundus sp.]
MNRIVNAHESGFVLVTALIMLSLLTVLSLGMYFSSRTAVQTSSAAQKSTEAYYYAETAIHYISWAMAQDSTADLLPDGAEFDNFAYAGTYIHGAFGEPLTPANAADIGDFGEWGAYMWDPGPTLDNSDSGDGIIGQLMYFDNSPMGNRELCFENATTFPNCIDVTLAPASRVSPSMYQISVNLPRYIKLDISSTGAITPSIPKLPHQNPPVVGQDIPDNGAIIWITAVDSTDPNRDVEIFPLDPSGIYGGIDPRNCNVTLDGAAAAACPCTAPVQVNDYLAGDPYAADTNDANYASFMLAQACDDNTGAWLSGYGIVAYAIGYVNGNASHMIRSVIR